MKIGNACAGAGYVIQVGEWNCKGLYGSVHTCLAGNAGMMDSQSPFPRQQCCKNVPVCPEVLGGLQTPVPHLEW
jgi:hypothetical protein